MERRMSRRRAALKEDAAMKTIATKIIGSLLAITALSSLSGCVVDAGPYPARSVYYGRARTVYVEPVRPVYVRRYAW
jgi:hypothetical protein